MTEIKSNECAPIECPRCRELAELVRLLTARCAEYRKENSCLTPKQSPWQIIATAPKDRPILVWDGVGQRTVKWNEELGEYANVSRKMYFLQSWTELPAPPGKGEGHE